MLAKAEMNSKKAIDALRKMLHIEEPYFELYSDGAAVCEEDDLVEVHNKMALLYAIKAIEDREKLADRLSDLLKYTSEVTTK